MAEDKPSIQHKRQPDERWDEYLRWARRFVEWVDWDKNERDYKLPIGERLVSARAALFDHDPEWIDQLKLAINDKSNNLVSWRFKTPFLDWCSANRERAETAFQSCWDPERSVNERINEFAALVNESEGAPTIRIAEATFLHMAIDPTSLPILRAEAVSLSYKLTGHPDPYWDGSHLGERYEYFLAFLDDLIARAASVGVTLRDRLDAQSVVWTMNYETLPFVNDEEQAAFNQYKGKSSKKNDTNQASTKPGPDLAPDVQLPAASHDDGASALKTVEYVPPSFIDISADIAKTGLRISSRTLRRYHLSLSSRGFVILAGVSGTGKTWLAEEYAEAVGGEHELVAVAPNWTTNEDLLGFYNPVTNQYHHTPFSHFIRRAADAWKAAKRTDSLAQPYHIILDEMNLARVEHYFASFLSKMEIRARRGFATIDIGGGNTLELTPNLYVIGTVNIDETTHGFADKIWDRAQLVELDLPREEMELHLTGQPYADDILAIWDAVRAVGPFAYRVADDIADYVSAAEAIGATWQEALDEQVLQKILPKLKGTKPDVVPALEKLLDILEDRYPLSQDRAQQMLEGIRHYGFASYFG